MKLLVRIMVCALLLCACVGVPLAFAVEDGGGSSGAAKTTAQATAQATDTDDGGSGTKAGSGSDEADADDATDEDGLDGSDGSDGDEAEENEDLIAPDTSGKVGALDANAIEAKTGASDMQLISLQDLEMGSVNEDDGKFQFSGEVVGDVLSAGSGYCWVTVSDGNGSMMVYVKEPDAQRIRYLGRYGVEGTTVLVSGTFHLACDAHAGQTDFHATSVSVLRQGAEVETAPDMGRLRLAVVLVAVALVLLVVIWRLRERQR